MSGGAVSPVRASSAALSILNPAHQNAVYASGPAFSSTYLNAAFKDTLVHPETRPEEKLAARIGMRLWDLNLSVSDLAHSSFAVEEAIASGVSGPVGSVIARVALTASKRAQHWPSEIQILRVGFKEIAENPDADPAQKALARLGIEVSDVEADWHRVGACREIASMLEEGTKKSTSSAVAEASVRACQEMDWHCPETEVAALSAGLALIARDDTAPEEAKSTAHLGMEIADRKMDPHDKAEILTDLANRISMGFKFRYQGTFAGL